MVRKLESLRSSISFRNGMDRLSLSVTQTSPLPQNIKAKEGDRDLLQKQPGVFVEREREANYPDTDGAHLG